LEVWRSGWLRLSVSCDFAEGVPVADASRVPSLQSAGLSLISMLSSPLGRRMGTSFHPEVPLPREPVHASVPELADAELAALYYGQRIGGDFYDFIRVSPGRVLFTLLDVAGRLEQNRSLLSAAQRTFRSLGAELFAGEDMNESEAIADLCAEINRTILQSGGVHACPAFAGCYNEQSGIVCYVNAGHTPGLVRDAQGVVELSATGLPLGLFSHVTADASVVALDSGSVLLLVSRGVVEAKLKKEELGIARVKQNLQNTTAEHAKEFCLATLDCVKQYMLTPPTHDDVTVIALVRAAEIKAAAANR
jgi:serine phosphatase RsbU (regulator of sigma subunit)